MMNTYPQSNQDSSQDDFANMVIQTPTYPETPMSQTPPSTGTSPKATRSTNKKPILLIGALGAFLLIGLGAALTLNSKPTTTPMAVTPRPMAPQPTQAPLFLTLDAVKEGAVVGAAGEVLIAGSTLPQSAVVIFSDEDDVTLTSDDQGQFEETVLVDPAGGQITVVVFSDDGDEMTQIIQVTPETGVLGLTDGRLSQAQNNARNKERLEKVQNKSLRGEPATAPTTDELEPTDSSPTSVVVTTAEETKRIREFVQEKNQVKVNLKVGKEKIKELASTSALNEDEASPEDQTVDQDDAETPPAQVYQVQVVPASPNMVQKRRAISGIITQIGAAQIVIAHPNQRDRTYVLYINPETVIKSRDSIIPHTDLAVGNRVAAVGELLNGSLLASRVHVIPGLATGLMRRQPVTQTTPVSSSPTPLVSPTTSETPVPTVAASPSPTGITSTPTATPSPTSAAEEPTATPTLEVQ